MSKLLGFLIWGAGEPQFIAAGTTGTFEDGNAISLIHKTDSFDFSSTTFSLEMQIEGAAIFSHRFKMPNFSGKTANLINDPSLTTPDESFTATFINALCSLPKGAVKLTIRFFANDELMNEGTLTYNSDGQHAAFKVLATKFEDLEGTRAVANEMVQEEQAEKRTEENLEREQANYFVVQLENKGTRTQYVIEIHQGSLSEKIHTLVANDNLNLRLWRGTRYQLKVYDQDASKETARDLGLFDESMDTAHVQVVSS